MLDHFLMEDLQHTMRGRISERLFHARGSAAHGYFEVTKDISRYCGAKLFNDVGKRTPVFTRFSIGSGRLGSAETQSPGLRGMACKFYTEDGNWDLLCNNAVVFMANDPTFANGIQHSTMPEPASNLTNVSRFWDFMSLLPESTFFQIWLLSDWAMPFSYRHMDTFAGNTFKMINKHGEPIFVRFTFTTCQGVRGLTPQRAAQLAGSNPDYLTQDLVEAIERGDYPSWILNIQVMSSEAAASLEYDPFNVTKLWSQEQFPLIEVGRLTLNRNTANHFDEAEQSVFNPGNFVPGIRPAEGDKNLAGRMFAYSDTQMYRMGVNHNQLPINQPLVPVKNYQRDGRGVYVSQGAAPTYFPNSFGGPEESARARELDPTFKMCGDIVRRDNSEDDHFSHAQLFWHSLLEDHQQRLIMNFGNTLRPVLKKIQKRVLGLLENVDSHLAERVEEAINQEPDDKSFAMVY